MPERRIDAISKADALAWNTLHLPKGSSHLLKIISGQLSHMPAGEVMSAVVQKAAKGTFKVTLNGETFIIKGLPASLLGKEVSFIARQIAFSGKGGIDLFWLEKWPSASPCPIRKTRPQASVIKFKPQPSAILSRGRISLSAFSQRATTWRW